MKSHKVRTIQSVVEAVTTNTNQVQVQPSTSNLLVHLSRRQMIVLDPSKTLVSIRDPPKQWIN